MTLADLSIKRPVFAWMLMSGFIIFGAIAFGRLSVSLMPDVEIPSVFVQVDWPGAAPEVMETEIVDQFEQALVSVSGIDTMTSTIRQGSAQIIIEFREGRNSDAALLEVQSNISRVRLPLDVDNPQIFKVNPTDQEIMWLGVTSQTRSMRDLTVYAERYLRDKFQVLPGVGQLILSGFAERNLRVWVNHEKLKEYELTVLDVQNAIGTQHIEQAGGLIENDRQEFNVRLMGEGMTPGEVGDIIIKQRGGEPIYNSGIRIRDVATIEDGLNDVRSISKIDGIRGGGIGFRKQRGANSIEVANEIKRTLEEIKPSLPEDIKITVNYDESDFTKEAVEETEFTLILSVILTALVCWLFLGSFSSTFNVVMSIPTSILGTFLIMYFLNFSLNMFSLLALSLSIGIVVDDAIMVLENIARHREMGKSRLQAASEGAREITFAAMAATLAIIAVFFPIVLVEGMQGQFLAQFSIVLCAAVALSLIEAITLTPMRCSQFLNVERKDYISRKMDSGMNWLSTRYHSFLGYCLHHRWLTIGAFAAFFFASCGLAVFIRGEFAPSQDQSTLMLRYETPIGSSLPYTEQRVAEAEKIIQARPEVLTYFLAVGSFMGERVNTGIMFVKLKPKSARDLSQQQISDELRKEFEKVQDLKTIIIDLSKAMGGGMGFPITFSLQGPELSILDEKSQELMTRMKDEKLAVDIDSDYKKGQPELQIHIKRDEASARGVTVQTIANTVTAAIGGIREGKYTNADRRYDVRIRLQADERAKVDDLQKLTVRNIYGEIISIADVIEVKEFSSIQTVTRRNRERSITITANPDPETPENKGLARIEKIGGEILPPGYRLIPSQATEDAKDFGLQFLGALGIGVLLAYMILASQFNSYGHPLVILLSLPFAFSGAFIGLLIFNQTLNLYSGIGIMLLMGIVKKNAILLVEFTNHVRAQKHLKPEDALLEACPIRLRPILMTTVATIAAAVPPALALGPGAESRVPMAITIICGVAVSAFATLFVVPASYSVFESMKAWYGRHFGHHFADDYANPEKP
jgi:HAE1 family hydrophobic/amphiphilic exporter-1